MLILLLLIALNVFVQGVFYFKAEK